MSDVVPNTLAGFKAAFFDTSKRPLTEQDIFDAGVRSGMARMSGQHAQSDLYKEGYHAAVVQARATKDRRVDPLSDEDIDTIAESMPGGLVGFMKGWGWRNFARAVEAEVMLAAKPAPDDVPLAFPYAFLVTACESLNDLSPLEVLHGSALKDITPEPCQTRILDLPLNERNAKVITLWKLHQAEEADATDYEALEREHLGDPVKRTGIYQWRDTGPLETGDPA